MQREIAAQILGAGAEDGGSNGEKEDTHELRLYRPAAPPAMLLPNAPGFSVPDDKRAKPAKCLAITLERRAPPGRRPRHIVRGHRVSPFKHHGARHDDEPPLPLRSVRSRQTDG